MTNRNKASLQALFQQNDVPTGTDYADFIDSCVNLVETTAQSMAGPLATTELITPRISAANVAFGGDSFTTSIALNYVVSAGNVITNDAFQINSSASDSMNIGAGGGGIIINTDGGLTINSLSFVVSSAVIQFRKDVTISSGAFIKQTPIIVSAAGTAQATAAVLTNIINRGKGVVDGATTGFRPPANNAGVVQYLYNDVASANLWPPTGGTINALGANTAFPLAASTLYTITHITASAYAVK